MPRDAAEILKDALALPPEARAALIGPLVDSLDTEVDEDAEAAWREEIRRRLLEIDSGTTKLVPWDEARHRLLVGFSHHGRSTLGRDPSPNQS
jgi:putative addiction module component (TIGR02574 family)